MQALTGLSQDKHELQAFFHYCQVPPATLQARNLASGDVNWPWGCELFMHHWPAIVICVPLQPAQ